MPVKRLSIEQGGLIACALAHYISHLQLVDIAGKTGNRKVVGRGDHWDGVGDAPIGHRHPVYLGKLARGEGNGAAGVPQPVDIHQIAPP